MYVITGVGVEVCAGLCGLIVGTLVGIAVAVGVGDATGVTVGVGVTLGVRVGVGLGVGDFVGSIVGSTVGSGVPIGLDVVVEVGVATGFKTRERGVVVKLNTVSSVAATCIDDSVKEMLALEFLAAVFVSNFISAMRNAPTGADDIFFGSKPKIKFTFPVELASVIDVTFTTLVRAPTIETSLVISTKLGSKLSWILANATG